MIIHACNAKPNFTSPAFIYNRCFATRRLARLTKQMRVRNDVDFWLETVVMIPVAEGKLQTFK
jgi:hypothetical protein